ncbi:hybrid sensor histidine kinase/response regulator [Brevundimonas fontaquae]|uniref:hybrid sensor histidine kinase/response regulator n=1 Tax=Brevundimonas fontaquae TaxID=2813778 RepID=UPI001F11DF84|nr:response regulator [Brevundimonas fontaquae]
MNAERGRWRLFRHEAGRAAGPSPYTYVALFVLCLSISKWSVYAFGATVLWPANAVLLAAVLQLHRRQAIGVMVACAAINLTSNVLRGDPGPMMFTNVILNLTQVVVAAVLARRFCGAALDMRRPWRLFRFAFFAAAPSVLLSTLLAGGVVILMRWHVPGTLGFRMHHLFDMELLAMMIVTPSLLLLARNHRFRDDAKASLVEATAIMTLVGGVTLFVFSQTAAPVLFAIFPPLILLAFRLGPPLTAAAVMMVAVIGGAATLTGHGPIVVTHLTPDPILAALPPVMRQMNVFHLFLLCVVGSVLPITTLSTERRRLTARLRARTAAALDALARAKRADEAKSRFLALMSHEMRTPLTGVTGYADLLSRSLHLDAEGHRQVNAVRQCGESMLRLVEDLLEISRGGDEVVLKPADLRALIQDAVAPAREWAEIRGLTFDLHIAPEAEGWVLTDMRRLRQILHHLTLNASKFTMRGGVTVRVDRRDDRLRIAVSDSGCGMDAATLAGVFRLFEQADASTSRAHDGAGVGLALAKSHAERLNGTIAVDSVQWQGSTFTLEIEAPVVVPVETESGAPLDSRRMKVLIVDDHPANRDLLRIMLQAADCDTAEACDGREAVNAASAEAFDLILMDVRMPVMDGLAATRAIRALADPASQTPILAVTAEAMPEDAARCLSAGMDGHLAKPVTQAKLYAAIDETLSAATSRLDAQAA